MKISEIWMIYVPTVRNDGRPFRLRYHKIWDAKVREITGGLTILKKVKGQWMSDNVLFAEYMIPIMLFCSEKQAHEIADMTKLYYDQKGVFYYQASKRAFIK